MFCTNRCMGALVAALGQTLVSVVWCQTPQSWDLGFNISVCCLVSNTSVMGFGFQVQGRPSDFKA